MKKSWSRAHRGFAAPLLLVLLAAGCSDTFDTTRTTPPRGSLGRILYGVVCDRVGAQSLPTDVTGLSFQGICHADPTTNKYATAVDVSMLPPLTDPAYTADGYRIPLAQQQLTRTYEIARIEALGRDREQVIGALDAAFPDSMVNVLPAPAGTTPCDPPLSSSTVSFHAALAKTLSNLIDLYDDADQTLPTVTRAVGRSLDDVKADPDVQSALARLDARQGYRPIPIALGTTRAVLSYPRLVELVRSVVSPMLAEPGATEGPEAKAFDALLPIGYHELRTSGSAAQKPSFKATPDPMVPGRAILSRPRDLVEGVRDVLTYVANPNASLAPDYLVARDARGYASVHQVNGQIPAPFIDLTGVNGVPDGLADVDSLGQFITTDGSVPASPFFTPEGVDGPRDLFGRATNGASGVPMYDYVDAFQTTLANLSHDIEPFFAAGVPVSQETAMDALAALPVLAGTRDNSASSSKVYPPDPYAPEDWRVGHTGTPPAGLGTSPITVTYRAFHPESSPIADLMYALGQVLGTSEMDDMLALAQDLFTNHKQEMASLMGLALEIHSRAGKHPEAVMPEQSTFFDDLFVRMAPVAHEPGLIEDFLRGFADPKTLPLEQVLETFMTMKDDISYDTNNINGPSIDLSTNVAPPNFKVPVDRSQPDVGTNRSEFQKFLQLLHDTNGLSICTKDGAIVHIKNLPLPAPLNGISFNYPADTPNATAPNVISGLMCGVFGSSAPAHLNKCAVFGYQNVMSLLLDVLLGKALLQVNDPCLNTLMNSSFVRGLGNGTQYDGANKFLQAISGVDGFSLQPNLRGFARLLYFQTPYPGLPGDPNALTTNSLTSNFLSDTIDPIPSMVCDPMPFTMPDGTVYPLRNCSNVQDVLRARDADALFAVDELGFVPSLQPLATAFDKHHQPIEFANLWDVLHLHWGSTKQPASVCDPSLPRGNPRWCAQSGLVTYEPLFAEILANGTFERLQSFMNTLAATTVNHCTSYDKTSGLCKSTVQYDGIHVVSQAMEMLFDPQRTPGLVDRTGSPYAQRNDGQQTDPLTGMSLLVQAFKNMDTAFANYAAANPTDTGRHAMWLSARSNFVDTFLTVNGQGPTAAFADTTLIDALPKVIGVLREQVAAHCTIGQPCTWASHDLISNLSDTMRGPLFAASIDLLEALRQNDGARAEIEKLVTYLLDAASANDTKKDVLASIIDLTQTLEDETNLPPFERVLARAVEPPITDEAGNVVRRSLVDGGMRSLSKIFEVENVGSGASMCTKERDPNRVIGILLTNLVTPMGGDQLTPIEVLMNAMGDVNRADPSKTTKFAGPDYGNVSNEMSEFFLDPTRGIEQLYAVIKQIIHENGDGK